MRFPVHLLLGFCAVFMALAGVSVAQASAAKAKDAFFEKRVAPVLKKNCLECHNPDKSRGSLDLSSRSSLLEGGDKGPAVVPGNAKKSLLGQMIQGPKPKMPREKPPLSAGETAVLIRWIDDGAHWPSQVVLYAKGKNAGDEWWSTRPLVRPPLPKVKDATRSDNAIDRFVLAMLESKGMKPSAAADRYTFIRRVTYDLHGLPPTPQEIDAFLKDNAPDAFEKLIDRLLASPRYGERWGRHWLDIIHYADTHGYDKDKRRLWAWLFRDWVIRAFNLDMPYRRFVRYQLAGDVIFPDDPDGIIATGFVVAGPWDFVGHVELREGTVEKEKTRALDRDDMVANAMSTFCSMTVHCARCHDHKFDPIPMKEYYQLQAVFAGVERGDRPVQLKDQVEQKEKLEQRQKVLLAHRAKLQAAINRIALPKTAKFDEQLLELRRQLALLPAEKSAQPSVTNGYHSAIEPKQDVTKWVQVDLGRSVPVDFVRLIPARPTDFPDTPGFGFPVRFKVALGDDPTFANARVLADHTHADFANPKDNALLLAADGMKARYIRVTATTLWRRTNDYVFALAELQAVSEGKNAALGATVSALDSIEAGRWSKRHLVDQFDSRQRLPDLSLPAIQNRFALEIQIQQSERAKRKLVESLIDEETNQQQKSIATELGDLAKQIEALKLSAKVYAVLPIAPRPIHVLGRGDVERKGELAAPGALGTILPGLKRHFENAKLGQESARRAALAEWIVDESNVLTWRSVVNRVWHYHFGKGLVDTPNDFGKNGSSPSHPELLDWLAVEFRDGGGSFKKLHKLILLSQTYRQASAHNAEYAKSDADNRYLWRMNRQRLDAEALRDSVLAVSGKLELSMYGPGFDLFRFKDDHSPVYDHLDVKYVNRPESWRRTVYRFVVRSVPNPLLESLDCADPSISVPVRNTTLTALQALALLNNPFMVAQAEHFAERVRKLSAEPAGQVDAAYRLAFGRPPSQEETQALTAYIRRHGLANACRLLFNANEFVFVD
ncbi:MAG: DUF1553 domain-containing protein [Gemmataceae bacterium]|nr:DUF1553 domain-containing protein [Gemmataceae bacterium]MCI0741391.1 DUF1553 domain-containing protein [Gemmataceae bacterium]